MIKLTELEERLSKCHSSQPVSLYQGVTITNVNNMVITHLTYLKGKHTDRNKYRYMPYYTRLVDLLKILEENH